MSSTNKKPDKIISILPDITTCLSPSFKQLITKSGLCAGLLAYKKAEDVEYTALCSINIPLAPFNGSATKSLTTQLQECHTQYARPHVHSLKSSRLWKEVSSVRDTKDWISRSIFVPFLVEDDAFDLLLFSKNKELLKIEESIVDECRQLVAYAAALMNTEKITKELKITEHYIKELGHDLASSVQAIVSKVRNVRLGHVSGALAKTKLEEAEAEIMSIYRASDTMGITVDPFYNIRDGSDFSIIDAIDSVVTLCASEASERHIVIEKNIDISNPTMWGDRKAIESALTQYVMNAIKYARGSSKIYIKTKSDSQDRISVTVSNVGITIANDFKGKMWNFGERGREALELHANGSGIGLFTVRKIVRAHGGLVTHTASGKNGQRNTFGFLIPRRDLLRKENCFS